MGPEEIEPGDYRIGVEPVVHALYPIHDERTDLIVYLPANGRIRVGRTSGLQASLEFT